MNTRYLEEYLVFAEELNYSVAAKKLYISRPTLVEHLGELEAELGCTLVTKNEGKVALTPLGSRFVSTAEGLLSTIAETVEEYQSLSENLLSVTVAATNLPWLETILFKARHQIQGKYPNKQIDITTTSGPLSMVSALDEYANDIVVAGFKSYRSEDQRILPESVSGFMLNTEEVKLLMTADNPLFSKDTLVARDLDGATLMVPPDLYQSYQRDGVVERFAEFDAQINLRTMGFSDHFEYFSYDFGPMFGIVPTTLIPRFGIGERPEYRAFTLDDLPIFTDFYIMYKKDFAQSENGRLLIDEMRAITADA